jgi:hypothetical protein
MGQRVRISTPHYQKLLRLCVDHLECGYSRKTPAQIKSAEHLISTTNMLVRSGARTQRHLHLVRVLSL